jgi:hypothetical protein
MRVTRLIAVTTCIALWSCAAFGALSEVERGQMPRNLKDVEASEVTIGLIQNRRHAAIVVDKGTTESPNRVLLIARILSNGRIDPINTFPRTHMPWVEAQFKNDGLSLRSDTAHHGLWSTDYRFQMRDGILRLFEVEKQSMTLEERGKTNTATELWQGTLVDFASARIDYWAQTFDIDKPREHKRWLAALQRHSDGLQPIAAKSRSLPFKPRRLIALRDFDPEHFNIDFACHYFDHDLKFRNGCKALARVRSFK